MTRLHVSGAFLAAAAALLLAPLAARAASITLHPVADTTLIQVAPTNSNGAHTWLNSGRTQNGPRNRGLIRFDPAAVIPSNAIIVSAQVILEVVGEPPPTEPVVDSSFGLHRMLRPWGEGTNTYATAIGQGAPAGAGDATWLHARFPTNTWTTPGGAPGVDFVTFESTSALIEGPATYYFGPAPDLATDVQGWLANPASNFGWMLLCAEEGQIFTAKRFATREDAGFAPQLVIQYLIPPRIDRTERAGQQMLLGFRAEAGQSYTVEFRNALGAGSWQTLANLGTFTESTRVLLVDPATQPARFYRIKTF